MSHQLLSSWLNILVHFKIKCSLLWFWLYYNCNVWLWTFWWQHFSIGRLVEPLMVCWLSSFCFVVFRNFLYKGMLFPSFITEIHAQPSAFSSCFQEFFFFFFYVLWDLFLDKFFYCLFLFCSTVSLVFRLWHQTLRWRSHRSICLHLVPLYFIDSNVLAMMYAFMLLHYFLATTIF